LPPPQAGVPRWEINGKKTYILLRKKKMKMAKIS
jgi:hypothetical protein